MEPSLSLCPHKCRLNIVCFRLGPASMWAPPCLGMWWHAEAEEDAEFYYNEEEVQAGARGAMLDHFDSLLQAPHSTEADEVIDPELSAVRKHFQQPSFALLRLREAHLCGCVQHGCGIGGVVADRSTFDAACRRGQS